MEAVWDELPSGPPPRERRRFWPNSVSEAGAAFATFLLSLTVFSVAGLNAVRGSEIKVLPPESVLLYRDGEGDKAALLMAVDIRMINEASRDYGDVLTTAHASFGPQRRRDDAMFQVEDLLETVFTLEAAEAAKSCPVGARCVPATGQLFIQRAFKLLDLAGAESRTEQLGFNVQTNDCAGPRCPAFDSYAAGVRLLQQSPFTVRVTLRFNNDGEKRVTCVSADNPAELAARFNYLETRGWTTFQCEQHS